MLALAALLGLVTAIANPSAYVGFGNPAVTIFAGFVGAIIGISLVAGVGYLLSPERVAKYYDRTMRWLDTLKPPEPRSASSNEPKVSVNAPGTPPAFEEQKLDGNVKARDNQGLE